MGLTSEDWGSAAIRIFGTRDIFQRKWLQVEMFFEVVLFNDTQAATNSPQDVLLLQLQSLSTILLVIRARTRSGSSLKSQHAK